MRHQTLLLATATLIGAVAASNDAAPLSAQSTESFRLRGDEVAVFNLVGEMQVEAGRGSDVVVEVIRGGADRARLRIETGRIGDRETLRVITPGDRVLYPRMSRGSRTQLRVRDDGTFGSGWNQGRRVTVAGSGGLEAYADLRVLVPPGKRLAVHQGVGRVQLGNVDGQLVVEGSSVAVEARQVRGSLAVDVGSGRVSVRDADADLTVDTGSGSVDLSAIRGTRLLIDAGSGGVTGADIDVGELNVDVGSGSVRLAGLRMREGVIDTGSGSVQLGLLSSVRSLRVDSGSGSVTLTVPPALSALLEVRAGSGGINVDLPLQELRRSRGSLNARIGEGGGRIRIDAGSGAVRVREG